MLVVQDADRAVGPRFIAADKAIETHHKMYGLDVQSTMGHSPTQLKFYPIKGGYSDAVADNIESGTLMFSEDLPGGKSKGAKRFALGTINDLLEYYKQRGRFRRWIYEILADRCCHYYIDAEMYPDTNKDSDVSFDERMKLILEETLYGISSMYHNTPYAGQGDSTNDDRFNITTATIYESESSKTGKISRHYVLHVAGAMFASNRHCGAFFRTMLAKAVKKQPDIRVNHWYAWQRSETAFEDPENEQRPIQDHGVYTRYRSFRVLYSTKCGEERILKPYRVWTANFDGSEWNNVYGEVSTDNEWNIQMDYIPQLDPQVMERYLVQWLSHSDIEHVKKANALYVMRCAEPCGIDPLFTSALVTSNGYRAQCNRTQMRMNGQKPTYNIILNADRQDSRQTTVDIARSKQAIEKLFENLHIQQQSASDDKAVDDTHFAHEEERDIISLDQADITGVLTEALNAQKQVQLQSAASVLAGRISDITTNRLYAPRYYYIHADGCGMRIQYDSKYCHIAKRDHTNNHVSVVVRFALSDSNKAIGYPTEPFGSVSDYKHFDQSSVQEPTSDESTVRVKFMFWCYACNMNNSKWYALHLNQLKNGNELNKCLHLVLSNRAASSISTMRDIFQSLGTLLFGDADVTTLHAEDSEMKNT